MILFIAIVAAITVVKWLVYTGLVWIMIKIQKMQYNALGLFGATALAVALQFVPVAGNYLSWAALVYCLWLVTRADIAPDIAFTVAIPGAIMFCLNLWAFSALMGEIRPDLKYANRDAVKHEAKANTNETKLSGPAKVLGAARDLVKKIGERAQTNVDFSTPPALAKTGTTPLPSQVKPLGNSRLKGVALKGITLDAQNPTAMVTAQGHFFTVGQGEEVTIPLSEGKISMRCDLIEKNGVTVTVNGDQYMLRVE
jgi:hypothetical protein